MNIREIEVSVKYNKTKIKPKKIRSAQDAVDVARYMFNENMLGCQEQIVLLCLDSACQVIAYRVISTGSISAAILEPKMVFTIALQCFATSIILLHNHPTGNTEPSREDIAITRQIAEAGKILEIKLLDHVIIADDEHTSLAERGLI